MHDMLTIALYNCSVYFTAGSSFEPCHDELDLDCDCTSHSDFLGLRKTLQSQLLILSKQVSVVLVVICECLRESACEGLAGHQNLLS